MAFSIHHLSDSLQRVILQRRASTAVFFVCVLEVFSLVAHFFPISTVPLLFVMGILMSVVSYYVPVVALSFFAVELSYGAFGRMIASGIFSIRIVLFIGFVLGYGIRWLRGLEKMPQLVFVDYACLFIWLVGILRGYYYGYSVAAIFADSNAYLFIPFFVIVRSHIVKYASHFFSLIEVAMVLFAVKLLLVFIYFTGGTVIEHNPVYVYVRDTRVFEITAITPFVSRVFSSALFIVAIPYLYLVSQKFSYTRVVFLSIFSALFLIGFSRSLLLGLGLGIMYLSFFDYKVIGRFLWGSFGGFGIVFLCMILGGFQGTYFDLWRSRTIEVTTEVAAVSRFEQLPVLMKAIVERPWWGSGFGASLALPTAQSRNDGVIMRSSFEWGYLDSFVKLGVPMGLFLVYYLFRISREGNTKTARAITLTVLATHIFTPLLFHPLGMWMLFVASLLDLKTVHEIESTDKVFTLNF